MKLSVIIPYYNTNALIGRALDSLLDQDLDPSEYEIIVVDDDSSEEPVVLKDYVQRYPQISYYKIEHAGVSPARNFGMSKAQGEWLYFCDSDDFVQRKVLGRIVAAAEERQLDTINAGYIMLKPTDPVPEPRRNLSSVSPVQTGLDYLGNPPAPVTWGLWVGLFRRSFIESIGLVFENVFYVEDCLFKLQVLKHASRVAFIDVDLYFYMLNDKSIVHYKRQHDGAAFASAVIRSIEAKTVLINDPATPEQTVKYLKSRRVDDSIGLFTNSLRYCSVRETIDCFPRLAAIGAYPLDETQSKSRSSRIVRELINRKQIWIFLCRVFHIIPLKIRQRF